MLSVSFLGQVAMCLTYPCILPLKGDCRFFPFLDPIGSVNQLGYSRALFVVDF